MRIPPEIRRACDETGLPYEFQQGTRHIKIRVGGRFVGILPHGTVRNKKGYAMANVVSQIRRRGREVNHAK